MRFGKHRFTLYRRSDVGRSSWFIRMHLTKEGRHYRKSLRTTDLAEAQERAQHEVVNILAKVQSGTPFFVLQELGGWETEKMVRRYAHLAAEYL